MTAQAAPLPPGAKIEGDRLASKYRFDDPDMDLLGWMDEAFARR